MENQEQEQKKKDTNKIFFLIAVIVALLGCNAYFFLQKNKSDKRIITVSDERTALQNELDKLEQELEQSHVNTQNLSDEFKVKEEELQSKIAQLKVALSKGQLTAGELEKAKEDIKQLRYFVAKYTEDLDELKSQNDALRTERDSLQSTVKSVTQTAQDLANANDSLNNKVKAGAALKAAYVEVLPLRIKNSGKESEVSKANNTKKIKVNFAVSPNALATTGMHDVFLRVLDPANNLILGEAGNFVANNQELQYTYKTAIEYNGESKNYTIDWTNRGAFVPGTYTVILYADKGTMGKGTFTLK